MVETGEGVAVAFCGKLLADYGATVVKVERPGVDDEVRTTAPFARRAGGGCRGGASPVPEREQAQRVTSDYDTEAGAELLSDSPARPTW